MSEAILVVDMPRKCGECIFKSLHADVDKTWCCGLIINLKDEMICVDEYDFPNSTRPVFCPLKELPNKKEYNNMYDTMQVLTYKDGWNECLDKIVSQ